MRTKTIMVKIYMPAQELETVRARADACGASLSEYLREEALRPPRRLARRFRVAGLPVMDEVGSALGHAVRGEDGRTPAEAPSLAFRLHAAIMALRVEEADGVLPPAAGRGGNAGNQRKQTEHMKLLAFRASPEEEGVMRRLATAFGLSLSDYVRRRALGRPLQPERQQIEGMPAVRRCINLLGHAAWTGAAPMATRLYRDARHKLLELEMEAQA
ncbi:MAG: hypothetical protein K6E40_11785 [Desulfovibrio sp.]|nr:hypothetical protein [Desulfovibrio sp.]